jgi:ParB family chromosome partitioning protein
MWPLHNRLDDYVTEKSCKAEIQSVEEHGQLIPALGRRVYGDPDYDIELICGARRLFIARHLNEPLSVEVREISDREATIAIDVENRQRKEMSPYERGLTYKRWLDGGCFESQHEMAVALNISGSTISRLLAVAELPRGIVEAFPSVGEIREAWGAQLAELLRDEHRQKAAIRRARILAQKVPRPSARVVYSELLESSRVERRRTRAREEVISGCNGAPLFKLRHQGDSVVLILPLERISRRQLEEVQGVITDVLKEEFSARAESAFVEDHRYLT